MSDEGLTFIRHMFVTMALPQRDDLIEALKREDLKLEYAVMHGLDEEAERIRKTMRKITEKL